MRRPTVQTISLAGGFTIAATLAALAWPAPAVAQPDPPAPPDPAVPVAGPAGALLPVLPADADQYLLGQYAVPSAPGGPPGVSPNLAGVTNGNLVPQHLEPSAPGAGEIFDVVPGTENDVLSTGEFAKRLWHLYQGGYLRGSLLGQLPQEQLSAPLPGTAPPPGTALPPGPFLPAPVAPVPAPDDPVG